ncbi:MAG: 16S rRNA (cytosine(967)-C(5))-methyltransferase RsmB [Candidatus Latescibacteria bacterium]|nr:16S rRNA (cytosine(967)-C(5))-methyltransferase RsmB [Candidatus Latescibacterota bacterium]
MKFSDPARALALRLLCDFEATGAPLDQFLEGLEERLPIARDRRFARHLVLGVTRWQAQLDWILGRFTRRPLESCSPAARQILRLGAYQLLHLDKVPSRAAVHTAVELAKRHATRGVPKLVNAVLRRVAATAACPPLPERGEDLAGHLSVCHSHPRWLVERWLVRWGAAPAEALLQADNQQPPLYVRLNPLRNASPPETARPAGFLPGFFALEDSESFFQSASFREGHCQVQDINAGLPAALLQPQPGERVLDACSAPGGKATQLAVQMQDQGLVVAADLSARRLGRLRENQQRLGLRSLRLLVEDARSGQSGPFDRVLVDAPCSATGTLARHPDVRWRKHPEQLPALSAAQYAMLCRAFARLRPGGVLVYSTCSLETEENDGVVERFLGATPAARLEPAAPFFPDQPWAGAYVQTLPGREPGDGCFAARIRRGIQ